ncbi:MAG: GNAT family N-acetyltransferase [Promethearchaeota archaeon]
MIRAKKEDDIYKEGLWRVFNENLDANIITHEPVPYEVHCKWWETVFESEYVYIILYQSSMCGYIRLTKKKTSAKEKSVISIALASKFQHYRIGTYAYKLFEAYMKEKGVKQIIALTVLSNEIGQVFFEKNNFKMSGIDKTNSFKRYVKKL